MVVVTKKINGYQNISWGRHYYLLHKQNHYELNRIRIVTTPGRDWTYDFLPKKQMLYPFSYRRLSYEEINTFCNNFVTHGTFLVGSTSCFSFLNNYAPHVINDSKSISNESFMKGFLSEERVSYIFFFLWSKSMW